MSTLAEYNNHWHDCTDNHWHDCTDDRKQACQLAAVASMPSSELLFRKDVSTTLLPDSAGHNHYRIESFRAVSAPKKTCIIQTT